MKANQETLPVGAMCRLLSVSRSGFYVWHDRPMSARARRDVELTALIHQIHKRSYDGTYGAPRIHRELRDTYGIRVGRKRVERLMRRAGLQGVQKRRFRCTTRPGAPERFAPDLVQRHFAADRPNTLWLADVTYVGTDEGFLYVAAVLDVFSRLVVGWAMDERLGSQLVLSALRMAYAQRRPRVVIHHSDHGTEGGFKRSSQHFNDGGCDDNSKTAVRSFRTTEDALARPTGNRDASGTTSVLGRDCGGIVERGRGGGYWSIVTGRGTMVSGGWRYAAIASKVVDTAAVGTIPVVLGA